MIGTSVPATPFTAPRTAVSCGIPTPEMMRVVQIEPTPMPTLTASAPAFTRARAPSSVPTLPAITSTS